MHVCDYVCMYVCVCLPVCHTHVHICFCQANTTTKSSLVSHCWRTAGARLALAKFCATTRCHLHMYV